MTSDHYRQQLLDPFVIDRSQAPLLFENELGPLFNTYPKKSQLRLDAADRLSRAGGPRSPLSGLIHA